MGTRETSLGCEFNRISEYSEVFFDQGCGYRRTTSKSRFTTVGDEIPCEFIATSTGLWKSTTMTKKPTDTESLGNALPCLQAGVDIEGLDMFEPMLRTLRAKAAALGLS